MKCYNYSTTTQLTLQGAYSNRPLATMGSEIETIAPTANSRLARRSSLSPWGASGLH